MSNPVITLEFPFAVGEPTTNGRVYPKKVVDDAIARYRKTMENRQAFGELGEGEGHVSLSKVSHIVLDLKIEDDNVIKGDVEVLPTDSGKTLAFLHSSELPLTLAPVGSIDVDPDTGEVSSLKLHYVNVVADPVESK
jgi:hypothetical protein